MLIKSMCVMKRVMILSGICMVVSPGSLDASHGRWDMWTVCAALFGGALVGSGVTAAYQGYCSSAETELKAAEDALSAARLLCVEAERMRGRFSAPYYRSIAGVCQVGSSDASKYLELYSDLEARLSGAYHALGQSISCFKKHSRESIRVSEAESLQKQVGDLRVAIGAIATAASEICKFRDAVYTRSAHIRDELNIYVAHLNAPSMLLHVLSVQRAGSLGLPCIDGVALFERYKVELNGMKKLIALHQHGMCGSDVVLTTSMLQDIELSLASIDRLIGSIVASDQFAYETRVHHERSVAKLHAEAEYARAASVHERERRDRLDAEQKKLIAEKDRLLQQLRLEEEQNRRIAELARCRKATAELVERVVDGVLVVTGATCPCHRCDTARCPRSCVHYCKKYE